MTTPVPEKPAASLQNVWAIAGPSIAVFLMSTIAGVIIIRIVAGLGTPAVAAVTAGQRINFLTVALLMGLGAATTALVARAWGAKAPALAAAYTRLSLQMGLAVAIVMSLVAIVFAEQLAGFFRLEDESRAMAVNFIRWTCLFAPSQAIVMVLSTACRAVGDAKTPLFLGVFANGISIFGAWVFAYGLWGLPAMGVSGAAIGWGLAFTFSALAYLTLWMTGRLKLPYCKASEQPHTNLRHFLGISMPATIEQFIMQAAMLLFIVFVASYGTAAFAAYGVGMSLFSVAAVIGLGFSIASSALVGQSLGAGDTESALASARQALKLSLVIMLVTGGLSAFFAKPIAAAMVDDPEVIALTAQFLVALAVLQPLLAADFVMTGAMRGAGDTRFPLIAGLVAVVCVRLPLGAIVAWQQLPIIWIYAVLVVDEIVKLLLVMHRFRARRWLHTLSPGAQ